MGKEILLQPARNIFLAFILGDKEGLSRFYESTEKHREAPQGTRPVCATRMQQDQKVTAGPPKSCP
jgi:hypothetical protein